MGAITSLPLKWHGGKRYLASKIIALMPPHLHYVEPFAGGLSVLLARDLTDKRLWLADTSDRRGISEVANDLNRELVNFWTVLQHSQLFAEFHRRLTATPLARMEWENARAFLDANPMRTAPAAGDRELPSDNAGPDVVVSIDHACAFFICCRQSLAGRMKSFTALTRNRTRRGINGNASEWLGAVDGLPAVHERLRPVVIENMPAVDLIRREDTPGSLIYCDPPYLHSTRATTGEYAHEMSEPDHESLLMALGGLKGKAMISGYRSGLYDSALCSWTRHDFDAPNNSAGGKTKRRMTECLWCNF